MTSQDFKWMNNAHCLNDLKFTSNVRADREEAKECCYTCPVLQACTYWANTIGATAGIWGGIDFES